MQVAVLLINGAMDLRAGAHAGEHSSDEIDTFSVLCRSWFTPGCALFPFCVHRVKLARRLKESISLAYID